MTTNIFYLDEKALMIDVFRDKCNLYGEEFENIRGRYISLVAGVQELQGKNPDWTLDELLEEANELAAVLKFLLEINRVDMEQHYMLMSAVEKITEAAAKAAEAEV